MVLSPMKKIHVEFWKFLWKLKSGITGLGAMIPKLILKVWTWQELFQPERKTHAEAIRGQSLQGLQRMEWAKMRQGSDGHGPGTLCNTFQR